LINSKLHQNDEEFKRKSNHRETDGAHYETLVMVKYCKYRQYEYLTAIINRIAHKLRINSKIADTQQLSERYNKQRRVFKTLTV